MSAESTPHNSQDDFDIARRGIQGFRDPYKPHQALDALQRIEEQLEAVSASNAAAATLAGEFSMRVKVLEEQLEALRGAAEVVVTEFNDDNPFFGYSIEALEHTLHPERYASSPASRRDA